MFAGKFGLPLETCTSNSAELGDNFPWICFCSSSLRIPTAFVLSYLFKDVCTLEDRDGVSLQNKRQSFLES